MMADNNQAPQASTIALIHDARAVHDTASLRPTDITSEGRPAWVVAAVEPGPASGSATVQGAYVNADTGEFVAPANGQLVVVKEGQWRVLAASDDSGQHRDGVYAWSEPFTQQKRELAPEDSYSPFVHGGTIVFHPTPGAIGLEQFGTVRLLPTGWAQYAPSALAVIASQPERFSDRGEAPSDTALLTALLQQGNKLLSAAGFRQLRVSGRLAPAVAREQLARSEADLGAIFTYMLVAGAVAGRSEAVQVVIGVVRATPDPTQLRAISLGTFAASLFRGADFEHGSGRQILEAVRQRLADIGVPADRDAYLAAILALMSA